MRIKYDLGRQFFRYPRIPPEFEDIKAKLSSHEGSNPKARPTLGRD